MPRTAGILSRIPASSPTRSWPRATWAGSSTDASCASSTAAKPATVWTKRGILGAPAPKNSTTPSRSSHAARCAVSWNSQSTQRSQQTTAAPRARTLSCGRVGAHGVACRHSWPLSCGCSSFILKNLFVARMWLFVCALVAAHCCARTHTECTSREKGGGHHLQAEMVGYVCQDQRVVP